MPRSPFRLLLPILSIALVASSAAAKPAHGAYPEDYFRSPGESPRRTLALQQKLHDVGPARDLPALGATTCVGGMAGAYPCSNVDLLAFMPATTFGGATSNDIWGWTDPISGTEYALLGLSTGTAFIDLSDPESPIYVGLLPTHTVASLWRGVKVYRDHAFVVSEASGHGMQVFDLTQLRSVALPPVIFAETAYYSDFGNAHTIAMNEDSGFAVAAGSNTCAGGLHIVDVRNPIAPAFAGCFAADGYTHEPQCVTYTGPDPDWVGKEICLAYNEDTLTIVDVTDPAATSQISRTGYVDQGYAHQGWLSEDQRWAFMNDEFDESSLRINTRTIVWDVSNLDAPVNVFNFIHPTMPAIDHNLYVKDTFIFESNYRAGLRILDMTCIEDGKLVEVGYFDLYPSSDAANYNGTWSNYPYFTSGVVVATSIEEGMFVLRPNLTSAAPAPASPSAINAGPNRIDLDWVDIPGSSSYAIKRSVNGCAGPFVDFATTPTSDYSDTTVSTGVTYGYIVSSGAPLGCPATCVAIAATGNCTVAPTFAGVSAVTNTFGGNCVLEIRWPAATGFCSNDVVYSIYRDTVPSFTPGPLNRIASCVAGGSWIDPSVTGGGRYYYVVRAEDRAAVGSGACGGVEEGNRLVRPGHAVSDAVVGEIIDGAETTPVLTLEPPWLMSTAAAHVGAASFRVAGDTPRTCAALITPPFVATAGSILNYAHREQEIEDRWDGGTVDISTDAGRTWVKATPTPGYPGSFRATSTACSNDGAGTGSYTDDSGLFRIAAIPLDTWAGQEISVRFQFGTDGGTASTAWWIDEVQVTNIAVDTCGVRPWNLYRSTVLSIAPGWPAGVPLPLLSTSNIDPGWPRVVSVPSSETDLGVLLGTEPLTLYRLLDDAGAPVGNRLRLVKSGAFDVFIAF